MATDAVENIFSAELSFVPLFNLALQQNALPIVYELKLINNSGRISTHIRGGRSSVNKFPKLFLKKLQYMKL